MSINLPKLIEELSKSYKNYRINQIELERQLMIFQKQNNLTSIRFNIVKVSPSIIIEVGCIHSPNNKEWLKQEKLFKKTFGLKLINYSTMKQQHILQLPDTMSIYKYEYTNKENKLFDELKLEELI